MIRERAEGWRCSIGAKTTFFILAVSSGSSRDTTRDRAVTKKTQINVWWSKEIDYLPQTVVSFRHFATFDIFNFLYFKLWLIDHLTEIKVWNIKDLYDIRLQSYRDLKIRVLGWVNSSFWKITGYNFKTDETKKVVFWSRSLWKSWKKWLNFVKEINLKIPSYFDEWSDHPSETEKQGRIWKQKKIINFHL